MRYKAGVIIFVVMCVTGLLLWKAKLPYRDSVVILGGETFVVDVAKTKGERVNGLSRRWILCKRCGMLFVFDQSGRHSFWMKDMRFNIDILWISNGRVVHIEEYVSHSTPQRVYDPNIRATEVLEVPVGTVEALGVMIGDEIEISL